MAQNGLGANNAAMYSGMNGSIMPSAGHYSDMQTLMQNMETLSGWLQQNREEWEQLQDGLARVERLSGRIGRDGPLPNGDTQPSAEHDNEPTNAELRNALAAANNRIASLERTYQEHLKLQQLYEESLTEATERIRQYCFEQQQHVIALHQHYTDMLRQSRNETVEAQLTHQAWQAGLKRVSEGVRMACLEREKEKRPFVGRIRGLKEENKILRKLAGWEPAVDSDEDEEDAEEASGHMQERGRPSQSAQGIGQGGGVSPEGGLQQ